MRTCGRSPCTSIAATSDKRLTSTRAFYQTRARGVQRSAADDQVDELARHHDLLDELLAVDVAAHVLARPGELHELPVREAGGDLDLIAPATVDLDDQAEPVALEQRPIGPGPGLLPDPLTAQGLVDLGAEVRSEGEDQRGGGRRRKAQRRPATGVAVEVFLEPVRIVDELHHGGDCRVELKAVLDVAGDLVDRPVGLREQLARRALDSAQLAWRPPGLAQLARRRAARLG